jgi:hypothetical protein
MLVVLLVLTRKVPVNYLQIYFSLFTCGVNVSACLACRASFLSKSFVDCVTAVYYHVLFVDISVSQKDVTNCIRGILATTGVTLSLALTLLLIHRVL